MPVFNSEAQLDRSANSALDEFMETYSDLIKNSFGGDESLVVTKDHIESANNLLSEMTTKLDNKRINKIISQLKSHLSDLEGMKFKDALRKLDQLNGLTF